MPGKFKYVFKAWTVIPLGRRKGGQYVRYYYRRDMPSVVRAAQAPTRQQQLKKAVAGALKKKRLRR